jgi:hypothetical protein
MKVRDIKKAACFFISTSFEVFEFNGLYYETGTIKVPVTIFYNFSEAEFESLHYPEVEAADISSIEVDEDEAKNIGISAEKIQEILEDFGGNK